MGPEPGIGFWNSQTKQKGDDCDCAEGGENDFAAEYSSVAKEDSQQD